MSQFFTTMWVCYVVFCMIFAVLFVAAMAKVLTGRPCTTFMGISSFVLLTFVVLWLVYMFLAERNNSYTSTEQSLTFLGFVMALLVIAGIGATSALGDTTWVRYRNNPNAK
jgi:hypothetical protein